MAPAVILPTLGSYIGRRFGGPGAGTLVGGLVGGVGGLALREKMNDPTAMPQTTSQGFPYTPSYAMDPTTEDIPEWALQGAQALKQAGILDVLFKKTAEGVTDFVTEGIPGYIPVQHAYKGTRAGGIGHGLAQGGKAFLGLAGGGIPGALLGAGVGRGIQHLTGRKLNMPLVNLPLDEILSALGGSIGAVKGLRYATGAGH